jgi:hypothetical protein
MKNNGLIILSSGRCISNCIHCLLRFQSTYYPDVVLLHNTLSKLPVWWAMSFECTAESLTIGTKMNPIPQTMNTLLHWVSNGPAWLSASECCQSSRQSMHRLAGALLQMSVH